MPILRLVIVAASILIAIGIAGVGVRAISRERGSPASLMLFLATLGAALWLLTLTQMVASPTPERAELWGRTSYIPILMIPAAVYHFTVLLLGPRGWKLWLPTVLWPATFVLMTVTVGTNLFIGGVWNHPWGYYTRLTPAGLILVLWTAGLLLLALGHLIVDYRQTTSTPRKKRAMLLIAAFAAGDLGAVDFLPSFGIPVPPVGILGIAGFALIAAYTLRRHHLTDLTPSFAAGEILATMQSAVLVADLSGRIWVVNETATRLLHYESSDLIDLDMTSIVETPFNLGRASDTLMRGQTIRDRPMLWRTKDERLIEVDVSASLLRDRQGIPSGVVYVATDISDRKRAKQIEYQAFHDALTGLPNRVFIRRRLDEMIADYSDEEGRAPAVIFLDLDGFKLVNDSLGHSAGDRLLQLVSSKLRNAIREDDLLGRLGGDEFIVLMSMRHAEDASIVGRKILAAVQERLSIGSRELRITGSVGIALYPDHGSDAEGLLKSADTAMYAAKEAGKNQVVVCGPEMGVRATERFLLETALRKAVSAEELLLHYQPILDLDTDQIVGAEALLRWQRDGQLVLPVDFLSVAEETGIIREMGEWALFTACREASRWRRELKRDFRVGVNLSVQQLNDRMIAETVQSALALNDLPPHCLLLEITESAAMRSVESTRRVLTELKEIGVRIAIDDFGTGYSSLGYLQRFPLDVLKIDRSFVFEIGRNRSSTVIVSATLALARALDLDVIAEGVENRYQLAALRLERCRFAQGFVISRPVPAAEFLDLIRNHAPGATDFDPDETEPSHRPEDLPILQRAPATEGSK